MILKQNVSPLILLLTLSLIWGTSFILIKRGLQVFSPDEVGALRVTAAAIFLFPLALSRFRELKAIHYGRLFAAGLMGTFIPAFLFATAQTHISSSVAGILNTLSPLWTILVGALFFKQHFRLLAIFGIAISLAGTILLTLARAGGAITGINSFALLIVVACFFYGTNLNWIKFKIPDLSSITITSIGIVLIGPLGAAYLLFFTGFLPKMEFVSGAWKALAFILVLALMSTAVATLLFTRLLKIATPLYTSSVTYIMPVVSVMWGILDGEHLEAGHVAGMFCIFIGVYIANKKLPVKEETPSPSSEKITT